MSRVQKWRLIREETIVGFLMLALTFANLDAANRNQGTTEFIQALFGDLILTGLDLAFLACGLILLLIVYRRRPLHWAVFVALTLPLVFYIGSTILYTLLFNLTKTGVLIYIAFYLYLFIQVLTRPEYGAGHSL